MVSARRYDSPTHYGYMRREGQAKGYRVELTKTKEHWASRMGTLYRQSDGCPKGQSSAAIWKLDLSSIKELPK